MLLLRVQNSIKKEVSHLYSTDKENIVKAVLVNGDVVYYDLAARKVIELTSPNDTSFLTGGKQAEAELPQKKREGVFDAMISRGDTMPVETVTPKKGVAKKTIKKTAIKKKTK